MQRAILLAVNPKIDSSWNKSFHVVIVCVGGSKIIIFMEEMLHKLSGQMMKMS